MVISIVGAIAVFVSVSGFVADVRQQVGPMTTVVRLTTDVPAFAPIPPDAVEVLEVPVLWQPPLAIESPDEMAGLVPGLALPVGSVLEESDLQPPPAVQEGMRQIAITVDAETGVAGEIGVGDVVDIIATRQGFAGQNPSAEIAIEAAQILSIGTPRPDVPDAGLIEQAGQELLPDFGNNVVPVTFNLPTSDVLRLAYVESFATSVRLALRSPTDFSQLATPDRIYAPSSSIAEEGDS
ncbi:Flp pilus assembly protein CpaB [Euzebya tangerina]|uniref:Flp pilus assembly protein CpaB n=1 Tax=Euzebya tangerina TaxID=591198 RepID=UPI0013C2A1AF|nr:Flp pilus assembly protein CpaB [Euzebya tangerina]